MFKQLKYEIKARGTLRLAALGTVILLNAGMALIFGALGVLGMAGNVLSIVISSVSLAALLLIGLLNDFDAIHRLFVAPAAYLPLLTPVKPWKLLASRTIVNFVQDILFVAVGVLGLFLQIGMAAGFPTLRITGLFPYWFESITYGIMFLFDYFFLILTIYFAVALTRTVLAGVRGRTLLAVLAAFGCFYLHNLLNIALYPLNNGTVFQYGPFIAFSINSGSLAGGIASIALAIFRCAALFFATTKLMERKMNV